MPEPPSSSSHDKDEVSVPDAEAGMQRFRALTSKLMAVPAEKVRAAEEAERKAKRRKAKRK